MERDYHIMELWQAAKELAMEIEQYLNFSLDGEVNVELLSASRHDSLLRCAERNLCKCCDALSRIYPRPHITALGSKQKSEIEETVVTGVCCKDYMVIKTPRAHKSRNKRNESYLAFDSLLETELDGVHQFVHFEEIDVGIITVYPAGTLPEDTTDPNNICVKPILDRIVMALGIDDNGLAVSVFTGAVATDELPEGTYTIVRPRSGPNAMLDELVSLLKKVMCDC